MRFVSSLTRMLHKDYDRKDSLEKISGSAPKRTDLRQTSSRKVNLTLILTLFQSRKDRPVLSSERAPHVNKYTAV
jgi:hypothetical protein